MTDPTLDLTIATPAQVVVDGLPIASLRAEDESGGFGIHAGHEDMVTLLSASVVRWTTPDGHAHCCAVDGGVLIVSNGAAVSIACREAVQGESLQRLEANVHGVRAAQLDAMRRARVEQTRLHAHAVRQMLRYLRPQRARGVGE
ncbi:F0F1 ATP synthase subunit epsilon [Paraburkholderia phymatum]|uniref:ATP synthase epsilon chain n=1 Tax=Paraburkholderia phymatum (strain DSM 17167 / CIP 108236 / LMG 21445 / STM815) TaxID=391038 RepID=B2JH79_PARP8|nr:F0F1 ATP synthase subunit epsilon [Paraburkholderia phymatum]ACC70317.1 alternate F1F0 ATPase, F1 subunit epsilon [Paraburkholderia phymatum STM815]